MAHTLPASSVSWESFALTDTRWLIHAASWSLALLIATAVFPWFVTGYSVIFVMAILVAAITTYTDRREPITLPPPTIFRYMLVDGIFVSLVIHPLFVLIQIGLVAVGALPPTSSLHYGLLLSFSFVCGFYLCLGAIGHVQERASRPGMIPPVAATMATIWLFLDGYPRFVEYAALQQSRAAGVAAYERATHKQTDDLEKLRIGNSLHGFDGRVFTVTLDSEGRLLVSGGFLFYAGRDARGFARLLPDGQQDRSFPSLLTGDPVLSAPSRVLLASDGSIVINTDVAGSSAEPIGLTRVRPDGAVDRSFQPDIGVVLRGNEHLESMDVLTDGRLVVVSPTRFVKREEDSCLLRFDGTGMQDTAFSRTAMDALYGPPSSSTQPVACSISKVTGLAGGQMLVEGAFPVTGLKQGVVRLNPDGTLDTSYRPEFGDTQFSSSFVAPTGELFAVFYVAVPGSSPTVYEARCVKLAADGRRDPDFNIPAGRFRRIDQLAVQPDGKVLVAGTLGETDNGAIVRLLQNGQADSTFGGSEGIMHVDGFLTALVIQPDGRIVLGGEFQQVIGPGKKERTDRQNIARLLPDGRLDAAFNPR